MTKIIKLWHRTAFWTKVEKTFLYVGSTITGGMVAADAGKLWMAISVLTTITGGIVGFWMTDANKDGIIDLVQDDPNRLN